MAPWPIRFERPRTWHGFWGVKLGLALVAGVLVALGAYAATRAATGAATGAVEAPKRTTKLRVLAVGQHSWSAIKLLGPYLSGATMKAAGLPPVGLDVLDFESHSKLLDEIRALRPYLSRYAAIFVASITAARLIQQEVPDIPIVFEGVDDALSRCLVNSLHKPGRNATGYMHLLEDNEPRMLQLLHDAFPDLRQVVVLASGANLRMRSCDDGPQPPLLPGCRVGLHGDDETVRRIMNPVRLIEQARLHQVKLQFLVLCTAADLALIRGYVGADSGVLVPWQNLFDESDIALAQVMAELRRPAVAARKAFATAGGLMAVSVELPPVQPRESFRLLTQVLQGQAPANLPVSTPYGMRLTINARAAKAQGLRPTMQTWQRADEVLE